MFALDALKCECFTQHAPTLTLLILLLPKAEFMIVAMLSLQLCLGLMRPRRPSLRMTLCFVGAPSVEVAKGPTTGIT